MAAAAVRASPRPAKGAPMKARGKEEASNTKKAAPKKEIVSDDGETVFRPDDEATTDGQSPPSPELDEDTARVRVYDDGEVIYRDTGSESESDDAGDSGELSPHKAKAKSKHADLDDDTIVRRPVGDNDDDPEVVRIPSPDHDPEVVIRHDVSDDPEVVIRHDMSDDPEVVIRHDVNDDPEVVIRHDVSDDPEVVIRHDVSDDPEVVIRGASDEDPEVVINDDPEVVRVTPSTGLKMSDRSSDSEVTLKQRVSPRRRKERRDRPELVALRAPFKNCDSAIAESLWLRVLAYLPVRDLCTAALVSKEMHRLADDDEFWQPIVYKHMGYAAKPESRTWKEVFGMRNKYVEENRIRARRENFAIVDGRIVDIVAVKSVEKGRQGLVTYITGFDVFTDVLMEGKLGTSFVPVVLQKDECPLVALLPDNKMKVLGANGERTVLRPASLTPEIASSIAKGAKYAVELLSGMGRERALRVYPRQ